jgi:hypothetical protein
MMSTVLLQTPGAGLPRVKGATRFTQLAEPVLDHVTKKGQSAANVRRDEACVTAPLCCHPQEKYMSWLTGDKWAA